MIERLPTFPFDPELGTLGSWVRAIAHRQARGHVRRRARHREEALTQELAATLLDPDMEPSAITARHERREEVRAIIGELGARLPAIQRRMLFMHWLEDIPLADIAAALEASKGAVRGALRRIRPELEELLHRAGLDPVSLGDR